MMPREETALTVGCFLRPEFFYSSLPAHALKNPIKWEREAHPPYLQTFNSQEGLRRMKMNRQPDRSSQERSLNRQAVFCPKTGKSVTRFFFEKVS
jgi:hypothetical protein